MINCPKCGFEQPQDEFCAKCGVNMSKFRPPIKSFAQKIKDSLVFRAIALTLVIGVGILILKSYFFKHEDSATFSILEDISEKSAPDINLPALQKSRLKPETTTPSSSSSFASTQTASSQEKKSMPAGASPAQSREIFQLIVYFLEVPKAEFETNLSPNIKFAGSQVRGGLLPFVPEALIKNSKELGRESKNLNRSEFWEIFRGNRPTQPDAQEYGLSLQLQYNDLIENQRALQFSYLAHFPIFAERKLASVETSELTESIKIPEVGGIFIIGNLPRRVAADDYPLSGGVFDVLTSNKYRDSESEFVILVTTKP